VTGLVAVRDAAAEDFREIARIYGHHTLTGLGSFEEEPQDEAEMLRRGAEARERGLPWLVASVDRGAVAGYAYAMPYRLRSAYRYTLEDSIYVAPETLRQGIGHALLGTLLARCTALGYRQIVAVIGDSGNAASIGLHQGLGFRPIGILPSVGFKHGRWVDGFLMQRALGDGDTTLP
jgi:L-amino acid N-acyltransferase YncA